MGSSPPWHSLPAVALSGGRWWCEEARPLRIAGREAALAVTDVRRAPAPDLIGCRCSACSCWLTASASTMHLINHAPRHSAAGRVIVYGPHGCAGVMRGCIMHAVRRCCVARRHLAAGGCLICCLIAVPVCLRKPAVSRSSNFAPARPDPCTAGGLAGGFAANCCTRLAS